MLSLLRVTAVLVAVCIGVNDLSLVFFFSVFVSLSMNRKAYVSESKLVKLGSNHRDQTITARCDRGDVFKWAVNHQLWDNFAGWAKL